MGVVEQIVGAIIVVLILLDVFFTVLYARIGAGVLSYQVARWVWRLFRTVARPFSSRRRAQLLSLCGPAILVTVVAVWALSLTLGMGLVMHPRLGTSVIATNGSTPTDFISAMYAAGNSMAIVGAGTFAPSTAGFRILYLVNSLIGMSVISLTLTYLMQVYTAVYRRNTAAISLHLASGETGDASELIAGLGPEGQFTGGYNNLSQIAAQMSALKESHHFYPVLFYFRFPEPYYSVSRTTLVSLDTISLIKSGLDDGRYGWLKESVAVTQLWRACLILTTKLGETFLPDDHPDPNEKPDADTAERWRRRYFAALRRFRQAGIATISDEQAGVATYLELRTAWQMHVRTLAPALGYDMDEIDPAGADPEFPDHRREFRDRLRSAG